jgi:hypothetical protein
MSDPKPYNSFRPWIRWFVPLSVLVWIDKRMKYYGHVWYQDAEYEVLSRRRGKVVGDE